MMNSEQASRRCVIIFKKAFYINNKQGKGPLKILIELLLLVAGHRGISIILLTIYASTIVIFRVTILV